MTDVTDNFDPLRSLLVGLLKGHLHSDFVCSFLVSDGVPVRDGVFQ